MTIQHQQLQMFMLVKMLTVSGLLEHFVQEQHQNKFVHFVHQHLQVTGAQSRVHWNLLLSAK
ncbi:MAG: hypothetical protein EBT95_00550 [Verrucomicrobia bacterium]|nr:hypothetical protein [Verrucomicrobiota bacterium]